MRPDSTLLCIGDLAWPTPRRGCGGLCGLFGKLSSASATRRISGLPCCAADDAQTGSAKARCKQCQLTTDSPQRLLLTLEDWVRRLPFRRVLPVRHRSFREGSAAPAVVGQFVVVHKQHDRSSCGASSTVTSAKLCEPCWALAAAPHRDLAQRLQTKAAVHQTPASSGPSSEK